MADGYVIPFDDKLRCSLCWGRIQDARILKCGHTYCRKCLEDVARRSSRQGHATHITCSECPTTSLLPDNGVLGLPRCFVINGLIDEINQTFRSADGQDGPVEIGRHGFQAQKIFSCAICFEPMVDARYLPCGHSFCTRCLRNQPQANPGSFNCGHCKRAHALPPESIAGLPISYRIMDIAAEIAKNENSSANLPSTSSSGKGLPKGQAAAVSRPPGASSNRMRSNGQGAAVNRQRHSRNDFEDVGEAKKRAQAGSNKIQIFVDELNDNKKFIVDTNLNDSVADLKRKIHAKTNFDAAQQQLTHNGKNLDQPNQTLRYYGIANHDTVQLFIRLRGGS